MHVAIMCGAQCMMQQEAPAATSSSGDVSDGPNARGSTAGSCLAAQKHGAGPARFSSSRKVAHISLYLLSSSLGFIVE